MIPLLTAGEMRLLDDHAVGAVGIPGVALMETAGRAVFNRLMFHFSAKAESGPTAVVCGKGNNGGDGFVVARCLLNKGFQVSVLLLGNQSSVSGDALVHLRAFLGSGGATIEVDENNKAQAIKEIRRSVLIVDAILGTGLKNDVRGLAAEAIAWINAASSASGSPVFSVDIPSGASSDSGQVYGSAVKADVTVTFAYKKRGHRLHPAAGLAGRIEVADIGIPPNSLKLIHPGLFEVEEDDFAGLLKRPPNSHKGVFGHVCVFGGSEGMTGAPGLAAWAALRSGAGLATVAWPLGPGAEERFPLEIMTAPLRRVKEASLENDCGEKVWDETLLPSARRASDLADAIVVGPGMGTSAGAAAFLKGILSENGPPVVLDADALNLIAQYDDVWSQNLRKIVMTPHPGEAARLLKTTSAEVQKDRVIAAEKLSKRFDCAVVLKGAGTLIATPGGITILVSLGNPGMATAGMGDILSGVLGAFIARGLDVLTASRLAAYVHAMAGDFAADDKGREGLAASDVVEALPEAVQRIADRTL